jgi:hypothetical protein
MFSVVGRSSGYKEYVVYRALVYCYRRAVYPLRLIPAIPESVSGEVESEGIYKILQLPRAILPIP